jgi:hypothetical protein
MVPACAHRAGTFDHQDWDGLLFQGSCSGGGRRDVASGSCTVAAHRTVQRAIGSVRHPNVLQPGNIVVSSSILAHSNLLETWLLHAGRGHSSTVRCDLHSHSSAGLEVASKGRKECIATVAQAMRPSPCKAHRRNETKRGENRENR